MLCLRVLLPRVEAQKAGDTQLRVQAWLQGSSSSNKSLVGKLEPWLGSSAGYHTARFRALFPGRAHVRLNQ